MAEVTEQIVRESPEVEAYKLNLMKAAGALQPPTLPQYQVASFTPQQTAALEYGQQGIGAYQPYMQAGQQSLGQAQNILQGADTRSMFDPAQQTLQQATAGTLAQAQPIGQAQIQQYMNPYTNLALNQQLQEMNRQAQIQQQGLNAQAVKAGAFGGARQGIAQQELNRNLMQTQNQAIAQAMQGNYGQALSAAQQQQQAGLAGYGQLANMGQNMASLAGQKFNIGSQLSQGLGSLGMQQAALGQSAQQLGQGDVNFLYNLGAQQQKQQQAVLDAQRATSMQTAMQPYQQLAFQSDIYKGAPSSQMAMTTQNTPAPSPFQQIAGLGTGILGLAGAANSASKLF